MGRREWNREVERDRAVLEHILALLLALAALADRASGMPARGRLHVLAILGRGEAAARSFLIAMPPDRCPGAPAEADATPSPAAGDAARLAASFRVLALALGAMLAQARAPSPPIGLPKRKSRQSPQSTPSPAQRATSPPVRGRG